MNNRENRINELKKIAIKKRGLVPNATSKKLDIQKLSQERKEESKKQKKSNFSKSINPVVFSQSLDRKIIKKNPIRNLEKVNYKSAIVSLKNKKITKLNLPHGCFNAGLASDQKGGYICVYRPDEYSFTGCFLNKNYELDKRPHHKFKITNCADPRLLWVDNDTKLLMVYSSTTEGSISRECIRGSIIMDLSLSNKFIDTEQFRISPVGEERHKNWMPFTFEDSIFLVSHVLPHEIYQLDLNKKHCELKYKNNWFCPWPIKESLRGNTNIVRLKDGNYLGTFHTAVWEDNRCHYDNGVYIFEGKPPFNVLKCSNKTFLPAEDATEPHYRKSNSILCPFPVGMVVEEDKVIISYGDNDSCVKILETSLNDLQQLMLEVY